MTAAKLNTCCFNAVSVTAFFFIYFHCGLIVFYSTAGESTSCPPGIHSASKHARICARNEFILCSYYWSLQIKCCCNRVFIGFLVSLAFSNSQVAHLIAKCALAASRSISYHRATAPIPGCLGEKVFALLFLLLLLSKSKLDQFVF